jgi:hypothetical protein
MKAEILKLAGAKNDADFYNMFPTEAEFMAKYGKKLEKLKKAQLGAKMPGQMPVNAPTLPTLQNTFSSTPGFGATAKAYGKNLGNDVLKGAKDLIKPVDLSTPSGLAGMIGGIGAGINTIKQTKKNIGELEKYGKVSDVVLQAANSRPERVQNKYIRPEDNLVQNLNPLGSGTNYLAARNGAEIQNTYAPNDIYTDLGYEPLNNSNVKQYKKGGKLRKADAGAIISAANALADVSKQAGQLGGGLGSQWGGAGGETGGYTQMLGSFGLLGGIAGGLLDAPMLKKKQQAQSYLDKNTGLISGINQFDNFTQQNQGFMENGGWMNPEYNPQMIAKFGDYDVDQLFKPPYDADMLRSGGHLAQVNYTPPSEEAMYTGRAEYGTQMAMGGDLQVHRGKAETISYNPYLPNGGETVMFRGPSHDNGGMPISYGENGVEVEGGEPAQIMQDGGDMQNGNDEGNLLVFGNLMKPGTNQKFKNYIADLSKIEAKQNKLVDKTTTLINDADTNDQFDKLSLNTGQANLIGANMKLKDIAGKKKDAAAEQNAILDTAKEFGLESDALAKGKIKYAKANDPYAKFGAKMETFQKGGKKAKKSMLITTPSKPVDTLESFVNNIPFTERKAMAKTVGIPNFKGTPEQNQFLLDKTQQFDYAPLNTVKQPGYMTPKSLMPQTAMNTSIAAGNFGQRTDLLNNEESAFDLGTIGQTALSALYPFIKPRAGRPLDPNQLAPEYLASAMNQQEPVQAQLYDPMLTQATSISLQDQLNEVTAQTRDAMRMAQGDPSAVTRIASDAYDARNKIIGEQTRINQAERQRVNDQNISMLNDAKMKNLGILDQQYVRQATGKSKTKEQSIAIAKSIADKIAQNKRENMEATVMENMYPAFSFTQDGVAYKNPMYLASFSPGMGKNTSTSATGAITAGGVQLLPTDYDAQGNPTKYKKVGRNGAIVKAIKGL